MPERKYKKYNRIDCDEVMGEGSYAVISSPSISDLRKITEMSNGKAENVEGDNALEIGKMILEEMILEWNWVDDDGEPLPLPKDHPDGMDILNLQETMFLLTESGIDKVFDTKN